MVEASEKVDEKVHAMSTRTAPSSASDARTFLEMLGDDSLAVILECVMQVSENGAGDIARVACVCRRMRRLASDHMRRTLQLDLRPLGRRARWAAPHLARRCKSLATIVCDGTNVTDENVTTLLAASEATLVRLSLADCRHLKNVHEHVFQLSSTRLAEVNLKGSSWSPAALISLLRSATGTLVALNLSSTSLSHSSLKNGEDFGEVAQSILNCRGLRRLHLGSPVDFVPACLAKRLFTELQRDSDSLDMNKNNGDGNRNDPKRFTELEELSLSRNGAADDVMLAVIARNCPALRTLDIRGSSITAAGVTSFAATALCAPRLRSLLMGGCDSLDDDSLTVVASNMRSLEEIDLSMHQRVGPAGITALRRYCLNLQRLRISRNARITCETLAELARGCQMQCISAVRCRRAGEPALRRLRRELRGDVSGENVGEREDNGTGKYNRESACHIDWIGEDFHWNW